MKVHVLYLRISSYVGLSFGAIHFYGELMWDKHGEGKTITLQRPITAKEAKAYNLEMQEQGMSAFYFRQKGNLTAGFLSRAAVIRAAIKVHQQEFPGYILMEGDGGSASATVKILRWPPKLDKIVKRLNFLCDEWTRLGGYEAGNNKLVEKIDDEWHATICKISDY